MTTQLLFVIVFLLLEPSSGFYSTEFRNNLAKRIRIYHDVYFQQNFPSRREPDIRVLRSDKPTGEIPNDETLHTVNAAPVRMMIGNSPRSGEFSTFSEDSKRAAPVRMMIGNSPELNEFTSFNDDAKRAGPVRMMIGNSPASEEFAAFSNDAKRAGPVRMMIGNSPASEEFAAFSDDSKRAGPVRMMIGNSPASEEFAAFSNDAKRAGPVRMMIGNSPDSEEFAAFSDDSKRAGPVRMMIGNSPASEEFAAFSDDSKRVGPVRMVIGNSPASEEFAAFSDDSKRAGPVRMMIGNSPASEEFAAFSDDSKRAGPVRMMIGNSPASEEFAAFSNDAKRAGPVRMMIGNSPASEEFAAFSDDSKRAGPVRMMIGNSPASEEFAAFSNDDKRVGPVRMMIGNSPASEEFAAFSDDSKRAGPVRMMIGNSPASEEFAAFSDDSKRAGPVRMMTGNSPASEEFAAFSDDSKRAGPVRMMIGNSPASEEFAAFSDDSKRAGPVRMMIGNSPASEEFTAFSDDSKRADLVRMMMGNSPVSDKIAVLPHKKRADHARMMIGNSLTSVEYISSDHNRNPTSEDSESKTSKPMHNDLVGLDASSDDDTRKWTAFLDLIQKDFNTDIEQYHAHWQQIPRLLNDELQNKFKATFSPIHVSLQKAIEKLSHTDAFFRLFWPFSFDISLMNQKLALFGISGEVHHENIKTALFRELGDFQAIQVPVAENKIVLSFNHPKLVDGMNRSSLLQNGHDFVNKGKHLFNKTEEKAIRLKVKDAFKLISRVSPDLYKSLKQLIACIGFYKGEDQIHLGGSVSSALGVIWLDPSTNYNWSVPFYAEQIVHEFIHNSLFYEELVHGTFTDHSKFPQAKVISAIRRQLRDYDKSFHAAYVSTGLITFHAKAGYQKRAFNLAKPLPSSVRDLVEVNKRTAILTNTGEAMLQTMVDFLTLARIQE